MSPLQKIDNVLTQYYNLGMHKYNMSIDTYSDFIHCLAYEGYPLINETATLMAKQKIAGSVGKETLSEVKNIAEKIKQLSGKQNVIYNTNDIIRGN